MDRAPGGQAASRLAPGRAAVTRDDDRRAGVDHGEHGRAGGVGGDQPREVEHRLVALLEPVVGGLDLVGLEVDGEHTGHGLDERVHRENMDATTAVARRAAPTGPKPALRPTRYEIEYASPAPVGSVRSGCAGTNSALPP